MNSYKQNVNAIQIVASMQLIQVSLFGTFWDFFFPLNIFDPRLVKCMDTKAITGRADCEGLLHKSLIRKGSELVDLVSLVVQMVKNLPAIWETWVQSWVGKIPWRREWQPIPVLLPGEFHGQRSLVDYSPQCCKQSDMTE